MAILRHFMLIFVSYLVCASHARASTRTFLRFEGRSVSAYVPESGLPPNAPLVVLLHGYNATPEKQVFYFGLASKVDKYGFVLIAPEGTKNTTGSRFWNAFPACCDFENSGTDDVGFLTRLIASMSSQYQTDPRRVYLLGHSNGGFMTYRMGCELSQSITTLVSLAGTMAESPASACAPTTPINVIHVHGTADDVIRYNGGQVLVFPRYASAEATVDFWSKRNRCAQESLLGESYDFVDEGELPGIDTASIDSKSCADGTEVRLWKIENGRHIPSFKLLERTFTHTLLETLLAQRKAR